MSFSVKENKILFNNSPINIKGINWFGLETEVYCLHGLWEVTFDSLISFIIKNKFNAIRVPLSLEVMLNLDTIKIASVDLSINPKFKDFTVGQFMDYFVDYCANKGLLVMFDFHRFVGKGSITQLWYSDEYPESKVIEGWTNVVKRYMKYPNVFAIDLKNEPHGPCTWGSGDQSTDWKSAAERIGNSILAINPKLLIVVEGIESYNGIGSWWGGNLAGVSSSPVNLSISDRLVYSPHVYGPSVSMQPYFTDPTFNNMPPIWDRDFGYITKNKIRPLLIGEFGGWLKKENNDDAWQDKITTYIKENNISFFYWCLQPNSGDTGGILSDDWTTPVDAKLRLLEKASPNPTMFTSFKGNPQGNPQSDVNYKDKFMKLYNKIHNPSNGYFNSEGIPYHSVETLMVEAPDHGHQTTSEALSYYLWLEVEYGRLTKDWRPLEKAWNVIDTMMIPNEQQQPSNSGYNAGSPATYASEYDNLRDYPSKLRPDIPVGNDPIYNDLSQTHGNRVYGMHWLKDCDNFLGFGDSPGKSAYFNTFQRGREESVWKTVPQPSMETLKYGKASSGYLELFNKSDNNNYSQQYKYTNAPDADARAITAIYWAKKFADSQGGSSIVNDLVKKSSVMGDWLRYSMFDKYFKPIGCQDINAKGNDYNSAHYLLSWYYAWGGPMTPQGWAWKIGCSHSHFGYQNPFTAYILSKVSSFNSNLSSSGLIDWNKSFMRQVQLYYWLQSSEGAIAGGVTNSYKGSYEKYPSNMPTFFGMIYTEHPVYAEPPSNGWFGFQCWSMERIAEYYHETKDNMVKNLLDKWCSWANKNIDFKDKTKVRIPSSLEWVGMPDSSFNSDSSIPGKNSNLKVKISAMNNDIGIMSCFARILIYYGKTVNNNEYIKSAKQLMDYVLLQEDNLGYSIEESRPDYVNKTGASYTTGFNTPVYVPSDFQGKMPNGDTIDSNSTFLSLRSNYKNDKNWSKIQKAIDTNTIPKFKYHRFWGQVEVAKALSLLDYVNNPLPITNPTNPLPTTPVDPKPDPQPIPTNPSPSNQGNNISITIQETGGWQSSGKTYHQVDVIFKNNSSSVIKDLVFSVKADGIDNFWNCEKSGDQYKFPKWMIDNGGLKANESFKAGFIVYNSLPIVSVNGNNNQQNPTPIPVDPKPDPKPTPIDPSPVNNNTPLVVKNPTKNTIKVYNYLKDITGKKMLTGVYNNDQFEYVKDQIGSYPAIYGFDFMRYSSGYTNFDGLPKDSEVTDWINFIKKTKSIATACWHWNPLVPELNRAEYWKGFYQTYPFENYYDILTKDIDYIASKLKIFKDADIPVLWRPLHEIGNSQWFWWHRRGSDQYVKLYRYMYDRFTNKHGLTNLIWNWCPNHSYDNSQNAYYPGDDVVDIVAIDYPETWRYNECKKTAPNKLIALGEVGIKDMYNHIAKFNEAPWTYCVAWPSDGLDPKSNGSQMTKDTFGNDKCSNAPTINY